MKYMKTFFGIILMGLIVSAVLIVKLPSQADDFTKQDVERYTKEFMTVVKEGEKLFHSSALGKSKAPPFASSMLRAGASSQAGH